MHKLRFVALAVVLAGMMATMPTAHARSQKVLYSFCQSSGCPDGQDPYSPMVADAHGNLFGTTLAGGNSSNAGTIYELQKVKQTWIFHSLYSFCAQANCTDGSTPYGGLIVDTSGNLYGTTLAGGNANQGVVYEFQKNGPYKVVYSFCSQPNCADGAQPYAGLTYQGQENDELYDGNSTLYGSVSGGGTVRIGAIFSLAPSARESILYNFGTSTNDGRLPISPLIMDETGNLYGTAKYGGEAGEGTLFEISSSGQFVLLHSFCTEIQMNHCIDGETPGTGGPAIDNGGNLFGTTPIGGYEGLGIIYEFAGNQLTTLVSFCSTPRRCKTGSGPEGALVLADSDILYGVAPGGGTHKHGTAFEIDNGAIVVLHNFCAEAICSDGSSPYSKLIMDSRGALFGTTTQGGAFDGGAIFELP